MKKKGTFVQRVLKINLRSQHLFSLRDLNAGQKNAHQADLPTTYAILRLR